MPGLSPPASPIGNTAGGALVYNTWEYYDVQVLTPTLQPASPPNVATYGAAGETVNGQPVWKPMNDSILFFQQKRYVVFFLRLLLACSLACPSITAVDGRTEEEDKQG